MSKADRASEPSMDEILASIRKIIAEEPVGARKAGEAGAAGDGSKRDQSAPRATLDDILGMADSKPAAPRPTVNRADGPSWPFPGGAAGAASTGDGRATDASRPAFPVPGGARAPGAVGAESRLPGNGEHEAAPRSLDLGTIVPRRSSEPSAEAVAERKPQPGRLPDWLSRPTPLQPSATSDVPAPVGPSEPVRPAVASGGAAPEARATIESKPVAPPPPTTPATNGAKEPAKPATAAPVGASGGKPVEPAAAKAMESAATVPAKPAAAAPPQDRATAAPAEKVVAAPAGPAAAAKPAAAPAQAGGTMKPAPAAAPAQAAPPAPVAQAAPAAPAVKAAPASPQEKAAAAAAAGATVPATAKPAAAVASAAAPAKPPVVAAAPAAATSAAAPAAANGSLEKGGAVPVPAMEPATAVAKPAVMPDKAKAAVAKVGAAELVPGLAGGGVRTLDDAIIDLLRPMIRQWLDDNMPRMVEKALRIELAASLQAKAADGGKGDPPKH